MSIKYKRDLERLWNTVSANIVLPKTVKLTDVEYSIGWNSTTYILLELNNQAIFFILDTDGPYVQLFSHHHIKKDMAEVAVTVKNLLTQLIYPKQCSQSKTAKSD
jgi:HJR/Mrr/RecB family endonuclease